MIGAGSGEKWAIGNVLLQIRPKLSIVETNTNFKVPSMAKINEKIKILMKNENET